MSRSLDGTDDRIDCGAIVGPSSGMTYSCWIKPDVVTGAQMIWSMYDNPGVLQAYCQFFRNTTGLNARIHQVADSQMVGRSVTAVIASGIWYHATMTWNGGTTNASVKIYINGVQRDTTNDGAGTFTGPNTNSIARTIGAQRFSVYGNFWDGKLAHAHFYNRELSINEINQIMFFPGSIQTGLLSYYPLLGASPEVDYSTNGGIGTITGATVSADNPPISSISIIPNHQFMAS